MFGNILGKKEDAPEQNEKALITQRVSSMNLTEMRSYVNNKIDEFKITEDGLIEVLKKLTTPDEKSSKMYVKLDDMDSKKKKAFDLLLIIAKNRHISLEVIEQMQVFIEVYDELIKKYDIDYKDIYSSRFKDSVELAIDNVSKQAEFHRKRDVLGE